MHGPVAQWQRTSMALRGLRVQIPSGPLKEVFLMQNEKTVVAVKPDGIQRHLVGEVIKRFEQRGLKLVACKLCAMTGEKISAQYPDEDWWYKSNGEKIMENMKARGQDVKGLNPIDLGKRTRERLIKGYAGKPILVMVWQGANAVTVARKVIGATNPLTADVGTIRGDFTIESYELADSLDEPIRNIVHASGSVREAKEEIKLWFNKGELIEYPLLVETVLYSSNWGHIC